MTSDGLHEDIIIAGFGGQGVMLAGKLLAQMAMTAGKEVTYMPSYGAEVRGGTANCMVVIADKPVASPVVTEPDSLIVMNKASLSKFAGRLKKNGLLIINSSLISDCPVLDATIEVIKVPANDIAIELGTIRSANMVIMGAYLQKKQIFDCEAASQSLAEVLAKRHHNTLTLNSDALRRGAEYVIDKKL